MLLDASGAGQEDEEAEQQRDEIGVADEPGWRGVLMAHEGTPQRRGMRA
jgi:hypothetical protein